MKERQRTDSCNERLSKNILLFTLLLLIAFSKADFLLAATIPGMHPQLSSGSYAIAEGQYIIAGEQIDAPFVPASTLKLLTSLSALTQLGRDYRWKTTFYYDTHHNLIIQGGGDPLLTSEVIQDIAAMLYSKGLHTVNDLILDDSFFSLEGPPPGSLASDNPYDAESGALAVNFNTIPFKISANGQIVQAEHQTPLLPLSLTIAHHGGYLSRQGEYHINVNSQDHHGQLTNSQRYTGELFQAIFTAHGISVTGHIRSAKAMDILSSKELTAPLYVYKSTATLEHAIHLMLLYSSNFIANQIFLLCGAVQLGAPATWSKAEKAQQFFITEHLGLKEGAITVHDGSGLCRQDQISARQMLIILQHFKPYADLMRKQQKIFIKSGTMQNVYCYAGYFDKKGNLLPYVLFLNQTRNTRKELLAHMQEWTEQHHSSNH